MNSLETVSPSSLSPSFRANEPVAFPSLLHSGAAEELLFLAGKMILVLAEDGGGEGRGRQT